MNKARNSFSLRHFLAASFMMLALAWLTVCLPYVNAQQQAVKAMVEKSAKGDADNSNPLTNSNEEKNESGTSLLQEYLHEAPVMEQHFITLTSFFKCHPSDLYLAYHPELEIPPPDKA